MSFEEGGSRLIRDRPLIFPEWAMADAGTFTDSLKLLAAKGLRYRTVIDLGCADGHFFLQH